MPPKSKRKWPKLIKWIRISEKGSQPSKKPVEDIWGKDRVSIAKASGLVDVGLTFPKRSKRKRKAKVQVDPSKKVKLSFSKKKKNYVKPIVEFVKNHWMGVAIAGFSVFTLKELITLYSGSEEIGREAAREFGKNQKKFERVLKERKNKGVSEKLRQQVLAGLRYASEKTAEQEERKRFLDNNGCDFKNIEIGKVKIKRRGKNSGKKELIEVSMPTITYNAINEILLEINSPLLEKDKSRNFVHGASMKETLVQNGLGERPKIVKLLKQHGLLHEEYLIPKDVTKMSPSFSIYLLCLKYNVDPGFMMGLRMSLSYNDSGEYRKANNLFHLHKNNKMMKFDNPWKSVSAAFERFRVSRRKNYTNNISTFMITFFGRTSERVNQYVQAIQKIWKKYSGEEIKYMSKYKKI